MESTALIPISTLFIGINGFIALALSYITAVERVKTRVWHGESEKDIAEQTAPSQNLTPWAAFVEKWTQKLLAAKNLDDGILQRKVRAHGNFTEYVPHGLLFIVALELMQSPIWLIWFLGSTLTIARIAHAWVVITTYGPSLGRATGFFLTWLVYIVGIFTCLFYSVQAIL
ncbi:MAG: MAPEG family protein [Waterburya sp.]